PKAHTPPKHRRATHTKAVAVHKAKAPAKTAPTSVSASSAPVAAPAPAPSIDSTQTYVEPTGVVMSPVAASVAAAVTSDPKIEPALASQAIGAVGQTQIAAIHVIAYGSDALAALTGTGAT